MGLVYLAFAVFLTLPVIGQLGSALLGDPRIDVWNHAWGYWFVADALSKGRLPYDTPLVGGPDGGLLYFIDTPGALVGLPLTLLFGPAAAYNLVLIGRIALAGFAAHQLAAELGAAPRSRTPTPRTGARSVFSIRHSRRPASGSSTERLISANSGCRSRATRSGSSATSRASRLAWITANDPASSADTRSRARRSGSTSSSSGRSGP